MNTPDPLQTIFDEATKLHLNHEMTKETFRPLLERALALVGDDGEALHPLLAYAPRAWYEDVFPRS